ncbi:TPA: site-specific DNA-methyltransferase [Pasteurella multocida]|nr:site-specific DNA-methyltransferase [Pasteurella multocida]
MRKFDLNWLLEWSFKERCDSLLAHKIHRYPAIFIPELAEKIIETFSNEGDVVLDIFSGSGTTLLECLKLKRKGIGIELNPLAILITKVKTQYIDREILEKNIEIWKKLYFSNNSHEQINIVNKEFWFHEITLDSINSAISAINHIDCDISKNFLRISLSEILRDVSFCVHSGFKLHRDKKKLLSNLSFNKNQLLDKLEPVILRNLVALEQLKGIVDENFKPKIYFHDSRLMHNHIKENSVDLILTSPPYGDSKTTVAYGQFSAFSSELFGLGSLYNNAIRYLDNELLGGMTKDVDLEKLKQKSLTLSNVQELFNLRAAVAKDEKDKKRTLDRLKDIISFYNDLDKCINTGSVYLKKEGFFILVTASRIVHETKLHTDIIISELARNYGLKLKNIYYRDIHNKRMPRKVSATNVVGETTPTMIEESIIILQK